MSKILVTVALSVAVMSFLFSMKMSSIEQHNSNREIGIDAHNTFNVAYVIMPGQVRKVHVKSWRDYSDSDVVQVVSKDGTVYLTSYNNVILMSEDK